MGEEEKKAGGDQEDMKKTAEEEKIEQETKTEEPTDGDKKGAEEKEESKEDSKENSSPSQENIIVLGIYMHCEGCARKVRKYLKGFQGVEDVQTDCKTHKVVVKGEKADPLKVLERVQMKSRRQVELLSPIPKSPPPKEPNKEAEEKEPPKPEEIKREAPQVITVVLKVYMHCEACAQEIKKRIQRMEGVENVEADLNSSQVTVKGVFEPPKLVDYVYRRTGKQAMVVKVEPEKKVEEEKEKEGKEERKAEDGTQKEAAREKPEEETKQENNGGDDDGGKKAPAKADAAGEEQEEEPKMEIKKNEFYYAHPQNFQVYPQRFVQELYGYPPQIFSDENPNACSVM